MDENAGSSPAVPTSHHTKDKGDLGVSAVIFSLMTMGYQACLPLSEHLPFDIIAVAPDYSTKRVQSKYRTLKDGCVDVRLESTYADRNGSHRKAVNMSALDGYGIYCPEANVVLYVPISHLDNVKSTFRIRLEPTKTTRVFRDAKQYMHPAVLWAN